MTPLVPLSVATVLALLLWPRKSVAASITVGEDLDVTSKHNTIEGLTRGERNKNPGNIAKNSANQWEGEVGDDGTYVIFDTDVHGIRAIAHVLKSYQKRGVRTIHDMVYTYSGTDQAAYSKNVADALGLEQMDSPDLADLNTLVSMVTAIIHQENGRVSYTPELITLAVQL